MDVEALIQQLTLEEKVALTAGKFTHTIDLSYTDRYRDWMVAYYGN